MGSEIRTKSGATHLVQENPEEIANNIEKWFKLTSEEGEGLLKLTGTLSKRMEYVNINSIESIKYD